MSVLLIASCWNPQLVAESARRSPHRGDPSRRCRRAALERVRSADSGPRAEGLVGEREMTTGARNAHGGAFEERQRCPAMRTDRFSTGGPLADGDVCDSELSARLAASEPSPEARPASPSPADVQPSARKATSRTPILYDRSQTDLALLTGDSSSRPLSVLSRGSCVLLNSSHRQTTLARARDTALARDPLSNGLGIALAGA